MELIPQNIEDYCNEHTTPENSVLSNLNRETHLSQVYPRMLSGQLQGTFLRMISQMLNPRRILEIGTFTGYSAINLAQGLTHDGLLHTIDVDAELQWIIDKYLAEAGLQEKVILHIGDARNIIPQLEETWDLVFIDADKPSYRIYYEMVFPRVRPGGFILADNTLWGGKVLENHPRSRDVLGIKEFNDYIVKDERVENVLLPLRDGLTLVRKK
ncbi:MAG: O-methyltransferase [Syntrophothermus sp.]